MMDEAMCRKSACLFSPRLLPPLPGVRWGGALAVERLPVLGSAHLCCKVGGLRWDDRGVASTRGVEGGGARLMDMKEQYRSHTQ